MEMKFKAKLKDVEGLADIGLPKQWAVENESLGERLCEIALSLYSGTQALAEKWIHESMLFDLSINASKTSTVTT
jgi:hypothetical protein